MSKHTTKILLGLGTLTVLGLVTVYLMHGEDSWAAGDPPRAIAPAFSLPDAHGKTVSLKSFRGEPVLLNFWATWCPPCLSELPVLEAAAKEKPHCLHVLGITESVESPAALTQFAKEHQLSYPLLIDGNQVAGLYGVRAHPYSVLVDGEGRTVQTFLGPVTRAQLDQALANVKAPRACK